MIRELVRLRDRNQLTLPSRVAEKLSIKPGALLEMTLTERGHVELRLARIATIGSSEAEREERLAMEDIAQGRYTAFTSVDQFQRDLRERRENEEQRQRVLGALESLRGRMGELQRELDQVSVAVQLTTTSTGTETLHVTANEPAATGRPLTAATASDKG